MITRRNIYREDVNVEQIIKQKIGEVIDQWVNDLVRTKLATPQMDQKYQRTLWDRLKGSVSNLWHGRYDAKNNPNYWKNRFGDELGSQEESYDPRAFTLYEYKEIKEAVDKTEQLVEEIEANVEKLKIVKLIRTAAEDLKNKLFNLFTQTCPSQGSDVASDQINPGTGVGDAQSGTEPAEVEKAKQKSQATMGLDPKSAKAAAEVLKSQNDDSVELLLPEDKYEKYKPKNSKEKDIKILLKSNYLIDYILHKDFNERKKKHLLALEKMTLDFKHDALIKRENEYTIEMVNSALEKIERAINELG